MKFDNSTIEGGDFKSLGPGIYGVKVWEHRFETVNDKDVIKVMFKTELGETHWETFWLGETAQFRLKALSIACGIAADAIWDISELLGKDLTIAIRKETWQGKDRNSINRFEPARAGDVSMPDHNSDDTGPPPGVADPF